LLSINKDLFCPKNKVAIRKELGLPLNKKIIFFGAVSVTEKRKGFKELMEALKILYYNIEQPSMIHVIIAGKNNDNFKDILPFSYTLLGYLDHNNLPKVYQAADVFLSPSIEDSGPMMVNQSIMCGTPVVSFEIGVALDLVRVGQTGYLAKISDSNDFASGIKQILELDDKAIKQMSEKCRETGLNLCNSSKNISELMKIFNNKQLY